MSTVYLIPDGGLDVLAFHATTGEFHTENSTITDSPVEDGSIISDHVIHDPVTFSFEAMITESPSVVDFYGNGEDVTNDVPIPNVVFPGIVLPGSVTVRGFGRPDWRDKSLVAEMADRLTALRTGAIPCTVLTSSREYGSMLVIHVELPRGPKSLGAGTFKVDMRQLSIVNTATVNAPVPKEPRGEKIKAKGQQSKKDADEASKGALKSWAAGLIDGDANLGKFFQ